MKYLVILVQQTLGKVGRILCLARVVVFTQSGSANVLPVSKNLWAGDGWGLFWGPP